MLTKIEKMLEKMFWLQHYLFAKPVFRQKEIRKSREHCAVKIIKLKLIYLKPGVRGGTYISR